MTSLRYVPAYMRTKAMNRTRLIALTSLALLAQLAVHPAAAQQPRYRVVDLEPLGFDPILDDTPGTYGTIAINNYGEVVFARVVDDEVHAVVYLPEDAFGQTVLADGEILDLSVLDNDRSTIGAAWDINMSGQIVGQIDGSVLGEGQAVAWQLGASIKACPLGFHDDTLADIWSIAYAINDASPPLVVGSGKYSGEFPQGCVDYKDRAFRAVFDFSLQCPEIVLEPLSPLVGSADRATYAFDVNAAKIAGYSLKEAFAAHCENPSCNGDQDALTWPPLTNPSALETFPSWLGGHDVRGINDSGQLVGRGFDSESEEDCLAHALFWEDDAPTTVPVDLGSEEYGVPAGDQTRALAINNRISLQVVGANMTAGRAFLWEQNDDVPPDWDDAIDLQLQIDPNSGWELIEAHDINDLGCIVGWGRFQSEPGEPATINAFLLYENCPADCDEEGDVDGIVNIDDFLALLAQWGGPGSCDIDGSGIVNIEDFLDMLAFWGPCCRQGVMQPPQSVEDCLNRFGFDPVLLEKCICAVEPEHCSQQ
jgi:hypothetical protein